MSNRRPNKKSNRRLIKILHRFIPLLLLMLLTACVSQTTPPVTVYTIAPQWEYNTQPDQKVSHYNKAVLKILPIHSIDAFTSRNIIYTDNYSNKQYTQNPYIYSRWSDAPVNMLQTMFQVQLEKSGQFKAVIASTSSARADLSLECTLYDFSHHLNPDNTSNGVVRVGCYLINNKNRSVLAHQQLLASIPSQTENAQGAVMALHQAANKISVQLLNWLSSIN